MVDPAAGLCGRQYANPDRAGGGKGHGHKAERQCRPDTLSDQVRDRQIGEHGLSEIATHHACRPRDKLSIQRIIKTQLNANRSDLIGRCIIAGDDTCGIARREMHQQEHRQADHAHDGDSGDQPVGKKRQHQVRTATAWM